MKKHNNLKGSILLATAALIFGLAMVAQSQAADAVPPFLLNCLRSFIGAFFLFLLLLLKKLRTDTPIIPSDPLQRKEMIMGGLICGTLLAISVNFQQFGLVNYPQGVASEARGGFLTALYVVLVPIISAFLGKRIHVPVWIAVGFATVGIYLLSFSGGLDNIYLGDGLMLICAFSYSFHILAVNRYGNTVGGTLLSLMQFLVCGMLSGLLSLLLEHIVWEAVLTAVPQILYLGIISSGIGYTLQIYGQKYADPALASIVMSLESVFAALGGWFFSGNLLSTQELVGCTLVFAAIITAQLPQFFNSKSSHSNANSVDSMDSDHIF